jgi:hypothetical protein
MCVLFSWVVLFWVALATSTVPHALAGLPSWHKDFSLTEKDV